MGRHFRDPEAVPGNISGYPIRYLAEGNLVHILEGGGQLSSVAADFHCDVSEFLFLRGNSRLLAYVKKSVSELRTGKGTAHELIETDES